MKPSLQLKLGQNLAMTPQLQQAIRLLQLSTLDLQQEIQDLSKQFEMKKEEFLKVQGALEMLQILENEKNSKKT